MSLTDLNREADARQPNRRLANRPIDFCVLAIDAGENRYGRFFDLTIRAADADEPENLYLSQTAKRERRFALYCQHLPLHGVRLLHTGPGRGVYELVDGKACACRTPATQTTQAQRDAQPPRRPAPAQGECPVQATKEDEGEPPANEQQLLSIRKLCAALDREEPAASVLTFSGAGALIRQMSKEFNDRRRAG